MGGQWGMQQQPPQPQFGMQQQPPLPQFGMQQPQFGMQPQQPMFGMQPQQQQQQQQFGMGNQWGMMSQQPQPNRLLAPLAIHASLHSHHFLLVFFPSFFSFLFFFFFFFVSFPFLLALVAGRRPSREPRWTTCCGSRAMKRGKKLFLFSFSL